MMAVATNQLTDHLVSTFDPLDPSTGNFAFSATYCGNFLYTIPTPDISHFQPPSLHSTQFGHQNFAFSAT
jgi:hypothetical protein